MKNGIPVNLRTNTGRCSPVGLPQDCSVEIPPLPDGLVGVPRFARPALSSRACCAGGQSGSAPVSFLPESGTLPPPPPPAPKPNGAVNLRTNTGKCSPLKLPQDCSIELDAPSDISAAARFTRPPLAQRNCCAGPTDQVSDPQFSVSDAPLPPAPPPPVIPVGRINLRTQTGRCTPLSVPQVCETDVVIPEDATVAIRFTRPPLSSRACCAGPQDGAAVPVFDLTVKICEHIALETDTGFFALEDESGTILLECAP